MIALALDCAAVRLRQDGGNLFWLEIREFALGSTLHRNTEYFRTLGSRQRLLTRKECIETVEGSKSAVPRSDRDLVDLSPELRQTVKTHFH